MKFDLCGNWQFKQCDKNEWKPATVPGCNYLDLIANNEIPDPFYGVNEKSLYWVSEKDWEYTRSFTLDQTALVADKLNLVCDCLDTICDVFVNGVLVGKGDNSHLTYKFDIKNVAKLENEIKVVFYSPVQYVLDHQKVEKTPANNNGLNGIPHIRKPQCHFGWDWGPILTPSGISKAIYVEALNVANISDVLITQKHGDGKVALNIDVDVDNFAGKEIECAVEVYAPNGEKIINLSKECKYETAFEAVVEKPELWQIKDFSKTLKQPLYMIKIIIKSGEAVLSEVTKRIGLRTLVLNQEVDKFGQNFQFVLNGEPIFAKGANWIPSDSFVNRTSREKLEYYIKSANISNFNMIRVWGGGYYESDDFYDLCDEYGIIVWQDFTFACQPYPFFIDEFRANVLKEVECNVKRLRHHASLGLWCGNNEIELMAIAWKMRTNYVKWTEKFFWDILPKEIVKYDNITSYIAGTPVGIKHDKGFSNDNVGDTHLWAVWLGLHPMDYYRNRMTRFCSEFGFESLPDLKTIQTFAEPKDYSLTSDVFLNHQKCASGNQKMAFYIASRFRLPKNFEDYIYLSGICQQECIRDASEHWRRHKGQCNGSLFWQYNDCWSVCSWASIDYYGNFKALQYASKHFFNPLMVSIEDSKKQMDLYVVNDRLQAYEGKLNYKLCAFDGKVLLTDSVDCTIAKNSSQKITSLLMKDLKKFDLKNCVFVCDLVVNGEVVSHKTHLFAKEKDLCLPKPNINMSVKVSDGIATLTFKTDKFARFVRVYSKTITKPFSDNYFDILSGEEKTITLEVGDMTEERVAQDITLTNIAEIAPKASKFGDKMTRIRIFLIPINFGNWIYYHPVPKKIKVKEN